MSNVYTIRLSYGEEIVSELDSESEEAVEMMRWHARDFLKLINPSSVVPRQEGIVGGPFTFTGNAQEVNISTKAIALIVKTKSEFASNYKKQTNGENANSSLGSPLMM